MPDNPHNQCQTTFLHHRFDRELVFPLPNLQARASILDIHTRKWSQPPAADLKEDLAHRCVGYCGADLKVSHCTHLVCFKKKRKEKTTPFGINLMRSQVLYRAAQACLLCI